MSYDLSFYVPISGLKPEQIMNKVESEFRYRYEKRLVCPLSDQGRQRIDYVKRELLDYEPRLRIFEKDPKLGDGGVEVMREGMTDNGYIGISLMEDGGSISIGYSSIKKGSESRVYFREVWDYMLLLQRSAGYLIFDGQLGRFLNLETDFEEAYACYNSSSIKVNDFFEQ